MDKKQKKVALIVLGVIVGLGVLFGLHNHGHLDGVEKAVGISHGDHK